MFFPEASGVGVLAAAEVMAGSVEEAGASAAVERRGVGKMINAETFLRQRKRRTHSPSRGYAAEQRTAGEIVPMLVGASARYAEIEIAGMGVGLVAGHTRVVRVSGPLRHRSIHSYSGRSRALQWDLSSALFLP